MKPTEHKCNRCRFIVGSKHTVFNCKKKLDIDGNKIDFKVSEIKRSRIVDLTKGLGKKFKERIKRQKKSKGRYKARGKKYNEVDHRWDNIVESPAMQEVKFLD